MTNIEIIQFVSIITFAIAYLFFEYALAKRIPNRDKIILEADFNSLKRIKQMLLLGYFLAFSTSFIHFGQLPKGELFLILGAGLFLIGISIRLKAIFTLREQFTYTISISEDHQLFTKGVYKFIRHPGYLGQLLLFLGIAVSLGNWISILAMLIPILPSYLFRIRKEEELLVKELGEVYSSYINETCRLIPLIY